MNTAQNYCFLFRIITALAVLVLTAALAFPKDAWAAVGNNQICFAGKTCTVGEFVYNDSYSPLNSASCKITSRYPNGSLFLSAVSMTNAAEGDGWYSHEFTTPSTTGLYRTEVKCTVGSDVLALDKSFEVQTESASLSANGIAAATWSYSNRTLSSFGSLISDIWNSAARTLTGAGLSSGSIATKSDVDNVSLKIDIPVDKVVNGVKIDHFIESDDSFSFDLKTKIEKTQKTTKDLQVYSTHLRAKAYLVQAKWDSLKIDNLQKSLASLITLLGTDEKKNNKKTIVSLAKSVKEDWGWREAEEVASLATLSRKQILSLQKRLENSGKTQLAYSDLKQITQSIDKIYLLSTQEKKVSAKVNSIPAKIENITAFTKALDKNYLAVNKLLKNWDKERQEDKEESIDKLIDEVYAFNRIPKVGSLFISKAGKAESDRDLKNKTLATLGLLNANKELLTQKPDQAFALTWLELGSIVFKTIITNPSSVISQTVPLKYYLPQEVKRENILEIDEGLSINFDPEKNQYSVSGTFTLAPNESKTLVVRIDDSVYTIKEEKIASLRKQAESLFAPLKNTSYYAQGVTLKSDIDVSLDKVLDLSKEPVTPEEKIRSYREAKIELDAARVKIEKLKEIVTQAGSVGTFFGFVGGTQTLAVWGLIIIMVAGFVFLALYMRTLRVNEIALQNGLLQQQGNYTQKKTKTNGEGKKENNIEGGQTKVHRSRIRPAFLAVLVLLCITGIAGSGVFALTVYRNLSHEKSKQVQETAKTQNPKPEESVLPESAKKIEEEKPAIDVLIIVPQDSVVNIYKEASLDSDIVKTLKKETLAKKLDEQDSFVKIAIQDDKEEITGWVDRDFVEDYKKDELAEKDSLEDIDKIDSKTDKTVVVKDDLTSYVRVRKAPVDGEVIANAYADSEFSYIKEVNGWVQIDLPSGEKGWISKDFVLVR